MKKEKLNWIYRFILFVNFLFIAPWSFSQIVEKTIEKIANISEKTSIMYLGTSGSDLIVKNWDKKGVRVVYQLQINAKNKEDLDAFYQELENNLNKQFKGPYEKSINISFPFKNYTQKNEQISIKFQNGKIKHRLAEFKLKTVIYAPKENPLQIIQSFNKVLIEGERGDVNLILNSCTFSMASCKNLDLTANFCKNIKTGNVENAKLSISSGDISVGSIKNNLDLSANFSNIEVAKIDGTAKTKLSSSTFRSSDIKELNLEGSFVRNFVINNAEKVNISKYSSSEFKAKNIKNLTIKNASFSTFRIEKAEELMVEKSSSSKFYLNNTNIVDAPQCSFTDFFVGRLNKRFSSNSSSGSIELENVAQGFEKIKVDGQFVNINIGVEQGAGYRIKVDLEFPNFKSEQINFGKKIDEVNTQYFVGWKGDDKEVPSEIEFNCKSCTIKLD